MVDTARVLASIPDKVIVLTGASQPYRFRESALSLMWVWRSVR